MTTHEREAIAYAVHRQRAKQRRQAMLFGRVQSVTDLRTGERSKILVVRFPQKREG